MQFGIMMLTTVFLLVTMLIAGIVWAFGYSVSSNIIAINPYGIMYPKFRGIVEVFSHL